MGGCCIIECESIVVVMSQVHPTADIEPGVLLSEGVIVWSNVHIRGPGTEIGTHTIIGEKSYIAYGVRIGHRVKINAFVYICTGVTIEDGVMIAAGAIFTNDKFPRATTADLKHMLPSDPNDETGFTSVRSGATIGAGAVIGSGLEIGRFAMIGMGSIVTRDVPDFHLVVGNPARTIGSVCRCGHRLLHIETGRRQLLVEIACSRCGLRYTVENDKVMELSTPT
jgi:acetyltransferase-like isoleucine patch superfamily enzyme